MKRDPVFIRILVMVVALTLSFLFILTCMNAYRYYRLRSSIAENLLGSLKEGEVQKVRSVIDSVESVLMTARDMGENSLLSLDDTAFLVKKFLPVLSRQQVFPGLMLADDEGREFALVKGGRGVSVRSCRAVVKGSKCVVTKLDSKGNVIDTKEEKTVYDPRRRPWFKGAKDIKGIYWSPIYSFFRSGKPGVTASISWRHKGHILVFAIDIPLQNIVMLFAENADSGRSIFLYNVENKMFVSRDGVGVLSKEHPCRKTVACLVIDKWLEEGSKSGHMIRVHFRGDKWYCTMTPLSEEKRFFLGIAASENALFSGFQRGFFGLGFMDLALALVASAILVGFLWKLGLLNPDRRRNMPPVLRLHEYLGQGEGNRIEFKSTVRKNLKTGKPGKEIELAWLKAVVAFLNTDGGTLLLGVDDRGKVLGIGEDGFDNLDKCQLHIKNLINQHIGAQFSNFISVVPVEVDDKIVVMIECRPAREPVFLKIGKNEEFYIRSGPSSMKLSPSQMVSYILQARRHNRIL